MPQTAVVSPNRQAVMAALDLLYRSPAVFVVVFSLGFLVTFVPGALTFLRQPDIEELYAKGADDLVVQELRRRKGAGAMESGDWRFLGNALQRRYGGVVRGEVLESYTAAVQANDVDATALSNTIQALSDEKYRPTAVKLLVAWPKQKDPAADPMTHLRGALASAPWLQRHGALDALVARGGKPEDIAQAEAAVAVADVRAWTCENNATASGVRTILRLLKDNARDALRGRVVDELLATTLTGDLTTCVDANEFARMRSGLAALLTSD